MEKIAQKILDNAISYFDYQQLIQELYQKGSTTSGEQSEAMLHYTFLNMTRMSRLDKKDRLTEATRIALQSISKPLIWLALTEGWCGDAAQVLPVINKMAEFSDNITLKIILRDQHLDVMDAFLTNGARSIPKIIVLEQATLKVLGAWGPRPSDAEKIVVATKEKLSYTTDESARKALWDWAKTELQKWYAQDKTQHTQQEMIAALQQMLA